MKETNYTEIVIKIFLKIQLGYSNIYVFLINAFNS